MPPKNTKKQDEETKSTTANKAKVVKKVVEESSDSESEPDVEAQQVKPKSGKITESKAKNSKAKVVEEHSDEEEQQADSDDSDSDDESESESETEAKDKKTKEKKQKESFEDLTKRIDSLQETKKTVDKEISELEKQLKTKQKEYDNCERELKSALKLLSKTHNDEVTKAIKARPKRKGNVNGGFNKLETVPSVLREFLGFEKDTQMARPKLMSALNNKFNELGLKKGQDTTLDKKTAKALGLGKDGEGRVIKFTEFQSFLADFFKSEKVHEVEV